MRQLRSQREWRFGGGAECGPTTSDAFAIRGAAVTKEFENEELEDPDSVEDVKREAVVGNVEFG